MGFFLFFFSFLAWLFELIWPSASFFFSPSPVTSLSGTIVLPWRMESLSGKTEDENKKGIAVGCHQLVTTVGLTLRQFSTVHSRWWSSNTFFLFLHSEPEIILFEWAVLRIICCLHFHKPRMRCRIIDMSAVRLPPRLGNVAANHTSHVTFPLSLRKLKESFNIVR